MKPLLRHLVMYLTMSPPARGRGLKPVAPSSACMARMSPPARGRGLKQGLVG